MLKRDWKAAVRKMLFWSAHSSWQVGPANTLHPGSRSTWFTASYRTAEVPAPARRCLSSEVWTSSAASLKNRGSHGRGFTPRLRLSCVGFSSRLTGPDDPDLIAYPPALEVAASCMCFLSYLTISFFFFNFIYLFLAVLGLHCCTQTFSSCNDQGLLPSCSAWASHCGGFSCCGAGALGCTGFRICNSWALEHRLNSCGTQA